MHDLPAAPASLSEKENIKSPLLALASAEIQVKADFHVQRALQSALWAQPSRPFLLLLEATGRQPEQQQSSTRFKRLVQIHFGLLRGSQRAP